MEVGGRECEGQGGGTGGREREEGGRREGEEGGRREGEERERREGEEGGRRGDGGMKAGGRVGREVGRGNGGWGNPRVT